MSQIRDCLLELSRLDPVRACLTNNFAPDLRSGEWTCASISHRTVAYSCGAIAIEGEPVEHDHDSTELELCRKISREAARVMEGVPVGMGSAGSASFAPFFVAANRGAPVPRNLDEATIRRAFGGTLYPKIDVLVEPLETRGEWWTQVREYLVDNDDALSDRAEMAEGRRELRKWEKMVAWFRGRRELHGCAFVRTGPREFPSTDGWLCLDFPYLAIGITDAGSLVGIWGSFVD